METDVEYFRKRAVDERRAAMKAAHPDARNAHLQMAERYTELAAAIEMHAMRLDGGITVETFN